MFLANYLSDVSPAMFLISNAPVQGFLLLVLGPLSFSGGDSKHVGGHAAHIFTVSARFSNLGL